MSAPTKQLARKGPAAAAVMPAGPALVRLLPRHWTGRLVERCRVSERVVQDSVHGRHHGKYQLKVHQAALLLALEHQGPDLRGIMAAVAQFLMPSTAHLSTDELAKLDEGGMYASANIGV